MSTWKTVKLLSGYVEYAELLMANERSLQL